MINLPKVHFLLSDLSLQTFCSINIQLQGLTSQFQQEKTHELIRLRPFTAQTKIISFTFVQNRLRVVILL